MPFTGVDNKHSLYSSVFPFEMQNGNNGQFFQHNVINQQRLSD